MGADCRLRIPEDGMPHGQDGFKAGVGFTIGVTARDDYHHIPIPGTAAAGVGGI